MTVVDPEHTSRRTHASFPGPVPARQPDTRWGERGSAIARGALRTIGTAGWTLLVLVPVYWIVITSVRDQADFFSANPLDPPSDPTLANYELVWSSGFLRFLLNSVIVTGVTVLIMIAVTVPAAYVIARVRHRVVSVYFRLFLLGLAIPLQAVIIPVYLLIIQLHLYDTLLAVILPSAAFTIPVSVLVLVGFLRDIPSSLFEAMEVDGASEWRILRSLTLPLARPAIATVSVYSGLQVWNGFLFALILTQSPNTAVLPLALNTFRGQFGINVPATMAAVVLSTLPMLALFLMARRQLVAGLTAGFTK